MSRGSLMILAIISSKTSVLTRSTPHNILEGDIFTLGIFSLLYEFSEYSADYTSYLRKGVSVPHIQCLFFFSDFSSFLPPVKI
jgi:hypothetical protein